MLRGDNDHAQLDWSASSSSNPIRWRPRADHGQKSEPAKGQRKKGLTNRGPLQKRHDPEKLVFDLIGDGHRFLDKIMRKH
jgi:hypothetical protein